MRRGNIIRLIILALVLTGLFYALQSSATTKSDSGKECMEACEKQGSGKMIWENLPHQFFSSF
jgi:hypothetical protein